MPELGEQGMGRADVEQAVRLGRLIRLRRGWYAETRAHPEVVRAVQAGGVLGCVSALRFLGVWTPQGLPVHVREHRTKTVRSSAGLVRCPARLTRIPAPRTAVDPLDVCLRSAWQCLSHDDFVAVTDSVLHQRLATVADVRNLLGPGLKVRQALSRCDRAESGTETLVRLWLRGMGVAVRTQVEFPGVGRVDLLVGERLVVEVDSMAHHTAGDRYAEDRRRDLALRELGYMVVRLTYEQVVFDGAATRAALLAMIRRGDHWWGSRKLARAAPVVQL